MPDLEAKGIAIISVLLRDTLPRDHMRYFIWDLVEIKHAILILKQVPGTFHQRTLKPWDLRNEP